MERTFPTKQTRNIPDDSREQTSMPALWGIAGEPYEETGTWWCGYCNIIWIANFPRWDRILEKNHYIRHVAQLSWPCPGCVQKTLELIEEKKHG